MKNKILIHSPNLATPGGKQNYYSALQDKFKNEIDFFFYGAQGKKESKVKTITRMFSDYWKFYRNLRKNNYDLVHLNPSLNFKSFFRDCLFALLCTISKTKTIIFWRGWNWEFEEKYVQKILPFFRFTYGKATAMICLAKEFSDSLIEYGYNNPIYLETTVVDEKILEYRPETVLKTDNQISLLFLARVEKVKGIYETIESFKNLNKAFPNIRLDIAGTGGELKNAEKFVTENNISNINFLGWVGGSHKAELLYGCDIFMFPTYHGEGMPNCVLEAMATGKPIVTTSIGGVKDFFEDGKMGFLVETKNPVDIEVKTEKLLLDKQLMENMGDYNKAYAKKRFSAEIVCDRLESIYHAVINGQSDYRHSYPS